MKRYMVFAESEVRTVGFDDFIGSFEDLPDAVDHLMENIDIMQGTRGHIIDGKLSGKCFSVNECDFSIGED